jgi:hypothetical protein
LQAAALIGAKKRSRLLKLKIPKLPSPASKCRQRAAA